MNTYLSEEIYFECGHTGIYKLKNMLWTPPRYRHFLEASLEQKLPTAVYNQKPGGQN